MSKPDLKKIKLLVLDVDGVLTDGTMIVDSDGLETRSFNVLDGYGIKLWQKAGLEIALVSGGGCKAVSHRAIHLGIGHVFLCQTDKLLTLKSLLKVLDISPQEVAFVGDDLPDMPAVKYAGFGVAVRNAISELKECADYVTVHPGGKGAVREVIEYILKNSNRWNLKESI